MAARRRRSTAATRVINRIIPVGFPQVEPHHVNKALLILAAGALVYFWYRQNQGASPHSVPFQVGQGIVSTAGDVVAGGVVEVGSWMGVPETNPDRCAAAKSAGDTLSVSFQCPAGDFLSWWWNK